MLLNLLIQGLFYSLHKNPLFS